MLELVPLGAVSPINVHHDRHTSKKKKFTKQKGHCWVATGDMCIKKRHQKVVRRTPQR
uniref:Uncharacterized protein n=1 Tax=Anguilla anguilla TaxID=7936 RepID=A0A0E9RQE9_ANGAN